MHLPLVGLDRPLNRRYCKEPLVKLSVLLTWVPPDVVELHVRQSSLALLQVDLEVFVANRAQPCKVWSMGPRKCPRHIRFPGTPLTAAVVEYRAPKRFAF